MIRSLIVGILLTGMAACTTTRLEPGQSTSLTSAQIEDVKQSLIWDLERYAFASASDLKGIKFGKIAASKTVAPPSQKETVIVCGIFQLRGSSGDKKDLAFIGVLEDYPQRIRKDRLYTGLVGRTQESSAQLLDICRLRGMRL
jgi:hypothetical protein